MTDAQTAQAQALAAKGVSQRQIAAQLRVSRPAVKRALELRPPAPEPAEKQPDPTSETPDHKPALEHVRELMIDAREQIDRNRSIGDNAALQRSTRNAAALLSVQARLEKVEAEDADVIKISRAEIDAAWSSLQAKVAAELERGAGRVCAECGRALTARLVGVDEKKGGTSGE